MPSKPQSGHVFNTFSYEGFLLQHSVFQKVNTLIFYIPENDEILMLRSIPGIFPLSMSLFFFNIPKCWYFMEYLMFQKQNILRKLYVSPFRLNKDNLIHNRRLYHGYRNFGTPPSIGRITVKRAMRSFLLNKIFKKASIT